MEDKIELMPVAEAIALTNKNALSIESLARGIENAAKNGQNCQRYFDMMLPFDVMQQVMAAGYALRQERGLAGENIIVVSW
ncbi:hypothetical protein [Mucilaginibacter sp.]|jgi:L-serine deaminase|uniref:hypothetical protein n=1 Tax=Mucilaginibacter sp. TaxID=1882438 RepID=UPI003566822D